jgi:serine/threonine-protein kinase
MSPRHTDAITRLNAALEGRYRIESELGEGGMATVYLAEDLKHERKVALKVLRSELAAVIGAERFLAEIRTTAHLQHPHILPLHDSGDAEGVLFYAMPYVAGESLRDRLDRDHQLPVDEAVSIAASLAEALDYAHRQGVIHRDIKPANVLISEGHPLLADFGIALVGTQEGERLTETGLSLGTPFYSSPEQVTGDVPIGPTADVYALGCVLYEMLAGDPPHTGSTAQAILGKIMTRTPEPVTTYRPSIPPNVEAAVRKAIEKVPADRFTRAEEFMRALSDPGFRHGTESEDQAPVQQRSWNPLTIAFALVALILGVVVANILGLPEDAGAVARFSLRLPERQDIAPVTRPRVSLSPDGSRFAYVGQGQAEGTAILVREVSQLGAEEIPGSEEGRSPVFSPDGLEVAFLQDDATMVARLDGGSAVAVADAPDGDYRGSLDWGTDGYIYVGERGVSRVPASGGEWEVVVPQDSLGRWFFNLDVLPNGRGAVFSLGLNETRTENVVAVADFRTGISRELMPGVAARYAASGHLLVVRADGLLEAVPFDVDGLTVTGSGVTLDAIVGVGDWVSVDLTVSDQGTLLYMTGVQEPRRQVVWVDRQGFEQPLDPSWTGPYESVVLSPADRFLAVGTGFGARPDLWVKSIDQGALTRLTFEGSLNRRPVWSRDGTTLTFISHREENRDVYRKRADGVGTAEPILDLERHVDELDLSVDESWMVYRVGISGGEGRDLYALHISGDSTIAVAANPEVDEMAPKLSPDGRFVAYESMESGRDGVYVRPFPAVTGWRRQVSVGGGGHPLWSNDGRTLFYQDEALGRLMSVEITDGETFEVGEPQELFSTRPYFISANSGYDITSDDQLFVMIRDDETPLDAELILVQGFFRELEARLPR